MDRKKILFIFSILVSLIFVWLSFRNFNFIELWELIKKLRLHWLLVGIFLFLFSHFLRGIRWKLILIPSHRIPLITSQGVIFINLLGNNIFPLKFGDLWRIILLKKKENISRLSAGSSLVLERIYDGLSILLIIWSSILLFQSSIPIFKNKVVFYFGLFIFASFILLIFAFRIFSPKIQSLDDNSVLKKIFSGIKLLRDSKSLLSMALFSLSIWLIETLSYGAFLKAFGLNVSYSLLAQIIFMVNVALLIPAAPGNIGTFEYSMILATSAFGISKSSGLTIALVAHFLRYISVNVIGLFFLSAWHMKLFPFKKSISTKINDVEK